MRIITVNVNGIRSAARRDFFKWMARQRAEVVCVQELKAQAADLSEEMRAPGGFRGYFHHAEKKGYSGVGIYARRPPDQLIEGLGFADIVRRYYTNIELTLSQPGSPPGGPTNLSPQNGERFFPGRQVILTWSGQGSEWYCEGWRAGGPVTSSGWQSSASGRSWNVGAMPPGTYVWHVRERNSFGEGPWSATVWAEIVDPRRSYLPKVIR